MTDIKRIGDSGIHTVEGNLAGSRAAGLTKRREKEQQEYQNVKNQIKLQNTVAIGKIDDKFNAASDVLEQEFRKRTVGLVTAEEFRQARSHAEEEAKAELERKTKIDITQANQYKKQIRDIKRKKMMSGLSFQLDDEDEADTTDLYIPKKKLKSISSTTTDTTTDGINNESNDKEPIKLIKKLKNPSVDTSFLPDR